MSHRYPDDTFVPHPDYFFQDQSGLLQLSHEADTDTTMLCMEDLGFELVDSCHPSPDSTEKEEDYNRSMSHYLWLHPAGILASGEIYHWEDGDQLNSMTWSYEQLPGCSRQRERDGSETSTTGGASHGSLSHADGTLRLTHKVTSNHGTMFQLALALAKGGPLVPLDQWEALDLWFGAVAPQLPMQNADLDYSAAYDTLNSQEGIEIAKAWSENLPPQLCLLIKRSLGAETPVKIDVAPSGFAMRVRQCVDFAGRMDTNDNEKRLHPLWSSWLQASNPSAAAWLADPRAFEVSDCGMSLLQALIEEAKAPWPDDMPHHGKDPCVKLGLAARAFIEQAPLDKLMALAETGDSRGVTPATRCLEILSSSKARFSDGAMMILKSLLERLSENTPMNTDKATAMGAIAGAYAWDFRNFASYVAPTLDAALGACIQANVDWTHGGMVWSAAPKGHTVNEPRQSEAWKLAEARFKQWGNMDNLTERWALEVACTGKGKAALYAKPKRVLRV